MNIHYMTIFSAVLIDVQLSLSLLNYAYPLVPLLL